MGVNNKKTTTTMDDTESKYGDTKTEILYDSASYGPSTISGQRQANALMDEKLRSQISDGTVKDDPDRWNDDEPVEYYENMQSAMVDDEEGYNVAEHPDSPEDEFRDEDRS